MVAIQPSDFCADELAILRKPSNRPPRSPFPALRAPKPTLWTRHNPNALNVKFGSLGQLSNLAELAQVETPMKSPKESTNMSIFNRKPADLATPIEPADPKPTLGELEAQVQAGLEHFATAGRALAAIRSRKLFKPHFATFEDYLQARWKMTSDYAMKLITAASVANELVNAGLPQPLRESHARELKKIPTEHRADAWQETIETAGGVDQITAEQVATIGAKHRKRKARRKAPKAIRLKGKNWTIVLSRKSTDLEPLAILEAAADQLRSQSKPKAA